MPRSDSSINNKTEQRKTMNKTMKYMSIVALALTGALMTSCGTDDDIIENAPQATPAAETVAQKGYALPVTVNVTRQGDGTRATYNESTKKLEFTAGDKLFVNGKDESAGGAGWFSGALDYVPATGKFSGTIYTQNQYSGTADALFTVASADNWISATLLPAGYDSYGYLHVNTFNNDDAYDDRVEGYSNYTFATTKALAVEQFCMEWAGSYSDGFELSPCNAILNFTITGLTPSTEVTATLTNGGSLTITGNVTTNASGEASFAMAVSRGTNLNSLSLTVGGNDYTLLRSSKTLEAGHVYNINRPLTYPIALSSVTSAYVGSVITTDGNVYATAKDATDAGKTAVAKICYVGDNGEDAPNNHGLALALADEGEMDWSTAGTTCSGKNTSTPITGAKWLLASKDQWNNMITAAGGYTALRDGFSGIAGASNLQSNFYWSSTEDDSNNANAWLYRFSNGQWYHDSKGYGDIRVRACLAF